MLLGACGRLIEVVEADAAADAQPAAQALPIPVILREVRFDARVSCAAGVTRVDLGAHGAFRLADADSPVEVLRWPDAPALRDEFLQGPLLLSALARAGIYALHASAFRLGGSEGPVVAISAPSGTGKSTLARAARQMGWERLADDLLPLTLAPDGRVLALPHFPQLKLTPAEQYPADRPSALPLAALVRLRRGKRAAVARLDAQSAMHLVLASTIASRLFPEAVLARHFGFAAALARAATAGSLGLFESQIADDPAAADRIAGDALLALHSAIIGNPNQESE